MQWRQTGRGGLVPLNRGLMRHLGPSERFLERGAPRPHPGAGLVRGEAAPGGGRSAHQALPLKARGRGLSPLPRPRPLTPQPTQRLGPRRQRFVLAPSPARSSVAQTRPSGRGEPERGGGPLGAPTERAGGSSMARVVVNARPLVAVRRVVLMPRAANRRLSVASGGLAGFALRFKVARDAFLLPDGTQGYRKPRVLFCCCFV